MIYVTSGCCWGQACCCLKDLKGPRKDASDASVPLNTFPLGCQVQAENPSPVHPCTHFCGPCPFALNTCWQVQNSGGSNTFFGWNAVCVTAAKYGWGRQLGLSVCSDKEVPANSQHQPWIAVEHESLSRLFGTEIGMTSYIRSKESLGSCLLNGYAKNNTTIP